MSALSIRYYTWLPGFYGDNCFLKVRMSSPQRKSWSTAYNCDRLTEESWEAARQYLGLIRQLAISRIKKRRQVWEMTLLKRKGEPLSPVLKAICTLWTAKPALQLKKIGMKTTTCRPMDEPQPMNGPQPMKGPQPIKGPSTGSFPPSSLSLHLCSRKYCQTKMMGFYWWFRMYFLNQHIITLRL